MNECCFLLFTIIIPNNKSKQQTTNHKSINTESSSLTASFANTLKSEAAGVAPCPSVPGILLGILLGILRASATHAVGGARVGGTVAGT